MMTLTEIRHELTDISRVMTQENAATFEPRVEQLQCALKSVEDDQRERAAASLARLRQLGRDDLADSFAGLLAGIERMGTTTDFGKQFGF